CVFVLFMTLGAKHKLFCFVALFDCFLSALLFHLSDQETITAQSGQDVTLTCRAPNNNLIVVEWRRPDLGEVFVYRNNHFDSDDQHPSFKNRVDLQDRQMKDGDVSVILKDAMINDTGTYECRVFMEGTNLRLRHRHATTAVPIRSVLQMHTPNAPSISPNIKRGLVHASWSHIAHNS
uniref:Ig-like domain-containing protein n=1 Tax=Pundamilia nyererei TaxID=303518 RepID=A0A3B4HCI5_9CICH